MKELTIEEKAKAYDEVRDKIAIRFGSNVADEIFSPFEISEDERIRKSLIDMLKNDEKCYLKEIAWLEKQGEQKGKNGKDGENFPITEWSKEDRDNIQNAITLLKYPDVAASSINNDLRFKIISWLKSFKERVQPQREWSEEDEKIYSRIYDLIHAAAFANYDVDEDGKELGEYAKITNWFKFLKDRIQPQPKQKRDEEDSEHLDSIIESYKDLLADYKMFHDVDYIPYDSDIVVRTVTNDVNFLKSLEERYTWKPGKEQMMALANACEGKVLYLDHLNSLYQDLKKLREK